MKSDIIEYIKNCPTCQIKKTTRQRTKEPMTITDTSRRPFEKLSLDFIGPLPLTINGNQYALVIQDDLTKFTLVKATPTHDTQIVAKTLIEIFCIFGIPRKLRTDKDVVFCSAFITEINNRLRIQKLEYTPYHPESNGAVERTNASLKEDLKIRINVKRNDWDYYLLETTYSFNSAVHNSTGHTPFELLFGYEPPINTPEQPTLTYEKYLEQQKEILKDLHTAARQKQVKTKKETKTKYDKTAHERNFQIGEFVKLKSRNTQTTRGALSNPYEGPYKIVKANYPNIIIEVDKKLQTFHANRLIPYESNEIPIAQASTSKISYISSILTYLLIIMIPTTKVFEYVREIEHKSGLFNNFQGYIGNHVSDYTLITGFNLEHINQNILLLQRIRENIDALINMNQLNETLDNEKIIIEEIQNRYINLQTSTNTQNTKRKKTQLLLLGDATALGLIGRLLASKNSDIAELQRDDASLTHAVRNNIYILNNTVNNFQKEMQRIQYNEQQFNKNLQDLSKLINRIESKNKLIHVKQLILNVKQLFLQITLITDNLLMTLQSAILLAKRQLLHPAVLNTKLIKEALLSFKIPPSRILPILIYPDSPDTIVTQYNNFCSIETEIHHNNLLFSVTIPLIENNNYTQYELIPFPFANQYPSNELFTIIPSHHILLYSQQSSTFALFNGLPNCIQISQTYKICILHHMQNTLAGPYEIGLLLEDSTQC